MGMGFEITDMDVQTVMHWRLRMSPAQASDERASELFDALDCDAVEGAALMGDDMDDQTEYAHQEIARQLVCHLIEERMHALTAGGRFGAMDSERAEEFAEILAGRVDSVKVARALEAAPPGSFDKIFAQCVESELSLIEAKDLRAQIKGDQSAGAAKAAKGRKAL